MSVEAIAGFPPAFLFLAAAALAALLPHRLVFVATLGAPVLGALNLLALSPESSWAVPFLDYRLELLRVDRLSLLFGLLFHLAAFIAGLFALHVRDRLQHAAALAYPGAALLAVFAGDLVTLFAAWELLTLASALLVFAARTSRSTAAGMRYLLVQIASGVILLLGAIMHVAETGSVAFDLIGLESAAGWLILLAFGIKCAFPLLHGWLVDAYPESTPTGTVFLSAFTTKVAVYALARAFPGAEPLVYVGAAMTAFPIFYAVIENDLRRVLAYSMINQIGFMVCGIGLGTELALNGAVSHAFNDVIFKGLLFMSMGAVLQMTGRINGSDLGGLYKTMPVTTALCIVGAASISAFPLFSGFVSKTMVMQAALEQGYGWIWLVLLFASAGVFHHAGIKIPYFAFFAHDSGVRAKEPPLNMLVAMGLAAAICVFNGSYPRLLYSLLPFPVAYEPYTATHVLAQLQLLFFSALAFTWLMLTKRYPPELRSVNLDADWAYRAGLPRLAAFAVRVGQPIDRALRNLVKRPAQRLVLELVRQHGPHGALSRDWPSGSMALWATALLAVALILYFR
jgi:multicomponent Na+:H+ antiporter subunit D